MILVLDNYDSFTFNLVHYLQRAGATVEVVRSDGLSASDAVASGARGFLISPGPGSPQEAGHSLDLVGACAEARKPLLGVCLGHQAIAQAFGGTIERAETVMHGKVSSVTHDGSGLFAGLPSPMEATRYHSLVVDPSSLPPELRINASGPDATVQGISHRELPIHGVQFHPESIASEHGMDLIRNFVALVASN